MTDRSAGAESFRRRGCHSLPGSGSPSGMRCTPAPAGQAAQGYGGRFSLHPPRPQGVAHRAAPSTPGGPSGWDPANSRRDCHPSLVRPSRLYWGGRWVWECWFPSQFQGARKRNGSWGPKARPLEAQKGQTQRLAQRDQRPPRPLREGNGGEEKPRGL